MATKKPKDMSDAEISEYIKTDEFKRKRSKFMQKMAKEEENRPKVLTRKREQSAKARFLQKCDNAGFTQEQTKVLVHIMNKLDEKSNEGHDHYKKWAT